MSIKDIIYDLELDEIAVFEELCLEGSNGVWVMIMDRLRDLGFEVEGLRKTSIEKVKVKLDMNSDEIIIAINDITATFPTELESSELWNQKTWSDAIDESRGQIEILTRYLIKALVTREVLRACYWIFNAGTEMSDPLFGIEASVDVAELAAARRAEAGAVVEPGVEQGTEALDDGSYPKKGGGVSYGKG